MLEHQRRQMTDGAMSTFFVADRQPLLGNATVLIQRLVSFPERQTPHK